jgi:hypothetical protein
MTDRTKRLSRRNFLLTVGVGGAAGAAAIVATKSGQVQPAKDSNDKRATRGYQASEHIANYYRTTKV